MRYVLLLVLAVLVWGPVCGEEPFLSDVEWDNSATVAGTRDATSADVTPSTGRAAVALVMGVGVLLVIVVGGICIIRLATRRQARGPVARHLQLIESLSLGGRRSLHLIRLGDQVLVLGQHEQGLTAVTSIPVTQLPLLMEAEADAEALVPPDVATAGGQPFAQAFAAAVQQVLGREKP